MTDMNPMTMDEAHTLELELEKELRELDPQNEALIYYGSVWKAIDGYNDAIAKLRKRG